MSRIRVPWLVVALILGVMPGAARAVPISFSGTFTFIGAGFLFPTSGAGTADVSFSGTTIERVEIPAGAFVLQTDETYVIDDPALFPVVEAALFADVSHGPGVFTNLSDLSGTGTLPLTGLLVPRLELFAPGFSTISGEVDPSVIGSTRTDLYFTNNPSFPSVTITGVPWSVTQTDGSYVRLESTGTALVENGFLTSFGGFLEFFFDFDTEDSFGFGPGAPIDTSVLGGSSVPGGLDIILGEVLDDGFLQTSFQEVTAQALEDLFGAIPFELPNSSAANLWNLELTGTLSGLAQVTFGYDDSAFLPGFDETRLAIFHLVGGSWVELLGTVDPEANTITAFTDSFSPFVLGVTLVPEPGTALLLGMGLVALAPVRRGPRA